MLLLIHAYPKASDTLRRHWPHFLRSGADEIWVIDTENGGCWLPDNVPSVRLGKDCYIDGSHLPQRLIDTLEVGLANKTRFHHIMVAEYDVLFLCPIRYRMMEHAVASHRAGSKTWGSLANSYYHNPWVFKREAAQHFIEVGKEAIAEGVCYRNRGEASSAESSPDVFFGYVCERMGQTVQNNLWTEFSRNSFDIPGDLELAREARKNGVEVIHGLKTQKEYDYVMS